MKNAILVFVLFAVYFPLDLNAQGWRRQYGQVEDSEQGKYITRTPDGGFLIRMTDGIYPGDPSPSTLMRLDADGDSLWAYTAGPFPTSGGLNPRAEDRAVWTPEGNIYSVFYDSLHAISPGGKGLWTVPTLLFKILGLQPDGLLLWKDAVEHDTLYLRKYDFAGNLQWAKSYYYASEWQDVSLAPDGRILVLFNSGGASRLSVLNASGNSITQFSYPSTYYKYRISYDIDGNYILWACYLTDPQGTDDNFVPFTKVAPNGQVLMETTYIISNQDAVSRIIPAGNGDLILIGGTYWGAAKYPRIYRLDENGNERWKRVLNTSRFMEFLDAVDQPDSSFVVCGYVRQAEAANSRTDLIVWRFTEDGLVYSGMLRGRLSHDINYDCISQSTESGLEGWYMKLNDLSCVTDEEGRFELQADSGTWALEIHRPGPYWEVCTEFDSVTISGQYQPDTVDISAFATLVCPMMEVHAGFHRLRRCFPNTGFVQWCNIGTALEDNVSILVVLPPELDFVSAEWPVSQQQGDSLWFDIGMVDVNECGTFQIVAVVNCDSTVLGQSLCVTSHIFPDTNCVQPSNWTGAHVEVAAHCEGDSLVEFTIKNSGSAPTSPGLHYIIIEDQVVLMTQPFSLPEGGVLTIQQPLQGGSLYRLEADQEPFHPGRSMPAVWVEGCGAVENQGLALQYAFDDADPATDIDCQIVVGSYDPNDKSAQPVGYEDTHLIEPNTEITYRINFQNTGTDTAFTVILRDTLSPWLDPASVRPGVSSHPFQWDIVEGNILKFTFSNILLPDSATDLTGSQGFVQFAIEQQQDVPLGTVIENDAAIYFDFNLPIFTNTTLHTVGRNFILVDMDEPSSDQIRLEVFPNPFMNYADFRIDTEQKGTLVVTDLHGRTVSETMFSGGQARLARHQLAGGVYYFRIVSEDGHLLAAGKVIAL